MTARLIACIAILAFAGCEEHQLPDLAAVQSEDIFEFSIDGEENVEANGFSFYTLTAHFKENVKAEKRKVRFSSTLGKFNDGISFADVVADADGNAVAYLKSDSVGVGTVKATVDSKYSIDVPVTFISPSAEFSVSITPSPGTVQADGVGSYTILVQFNEKIPVGHRKVTLKTSLGKFSNNDVSISILGDDDRVATAVLKSTDIGTAIVSLQSLTKKTTSEQHLIFATPEPAFTIALLPPTVVPADNISMHKIEVTFTKFNTIAERKILLETTLGKFTNANSSITVFADNTNKAFAYLKSDKIGIATIKATFDNKYSQETTAEFAVPPAAFSFISLPSASVPADNYSVHAVEILFQTFETLAARTVVLRTNMGLFANGKDTMTLLAHSDNKGRTTLRSSVEGIATVTAEFQGSSTQEALYSFSKSFPDQIQLTSPSFSLKSGLENQIQFETRLLKTNGQPSPGFSITYVALDTLNKPIGTFINNSLSRADAKATVNYSAGPAFKPSGTKTYRGRVRIRATLDLPNASPTSEIDLYIID